MLNKKDSATNGSVETAAETGTTKNPTASDTSTDKGETDATQRQRHEKCKQESL